MAKQPNIRFKGFTEEWKEAPLGELVKEHRVSNQFVHHQNLLSLSYGKIVRRDIHANKGLLPASFDTYQIIDKDTIVFRVTDLQNDKKSLRVAISEEEGIISPAYVCVDTASEEISASFLHQILHFHDVITKIYYKMGDGLRQTLNYSDLKSLNIIFPNLDEQKVIAGFFDSIDSTITRRENELEKLRSIKRALLEKIFPQDGQFIPAIRFRGFEEKWEPTVLGQKIKEINRKNANSTAPIMMIAAGNGFIYQSDRYSFNNAGKSLQQYIVLNRNELAYNHGASKLHPYGCCYALLSEDSARIPYVYHCFSTTCCPEFLSTILNERESEDQLRKLISSGARMDGLLNISFEAYSSISLNLPKIPEQEKIAKLVNSLNKTISLRERQITLLRHSKQALLEQMFVNE